MHVSNVMTADVVIIGGGVMGTATAFQMAKAGLDVILCEMRTLGSGASGRCGGMVVHCYGREANIDKTDQRLLFTRENTRMLKEFQQELNIDYEFRQIGCVDIATTEEEWQLMQDLIKTQRSLGDDENQLLDKQQLQELIPTLNPELHLGGRYRPSDGNLAPYKLCNSMAWGAKKYGARILTHTKVEKILIENDKIKGVVTDRCTIYCNWVLNATNAWSKFLTEETKCIIPVREIACVTEAIGPVPPQSFEVQINGEFAYGGTQTKSGNLTIGGPAHPREKRVGYYNETITFDEVQRLAHYVATVYPSLSHLKMIRAWTGTMAYAPDGMPIIGKSNLTEGLLLAAGFAAGISQECTVGKIMTDLVTVGEVTLPINMDLYNPNRFYGKTYEWPDPYDLGIVGDYLAQKEKGVTDYKVPYSLVKR